MLTMPRPSPGLRSVLFSSLASASLLAMIVIVSESYSSTPALELLSGGASNGVFSPVHLGGSALEQELVSVDGSNSKYNQWEAEAVTDANNAYHLEQERRRAAQHEALMQEQETHWLKMAQQARSKAEALRMDPSDGKSTQRLEFEKEELKKRLARNEEEMQMVESMEKQPAPWRGQPADASPALSIDQAPSEQGSPKISKLESELQKQIDEYHHARVQAERQQSSKDQQLEERQLQDEIAHFRKARHVIQSKLNGKAPYSEPSRAPQPKMAHPRRPRGSILDSAEKALGDSVLASGKGAKGEKDAAGSHSTLPGVNAYSWWSNKPAKISAHKEFQQLKHPKLKGKDCHDLYSCVGSLFTGRTGNKLSMANEAWEVEKEREKKMKPRKDPLQAHTTPLTSDRMVSRNAVMDDPQKPLLGALDGSSVTHDRKLPGVAENRWGGTKFWNRLLGAPAPTKLGLHKKLK